MPPGEEGVEAISAVDVAALAILAVAVLRGLWIGLIREVFSLGGLAAAVIAVRLAAAPGADWLLARLPVALSPLAARIAAGAVIAVVVIVCTAIVGRIVRRGARWAGLGFADRVAGGVLGAAEGVLVIAILMLIGTAVVGRDHPALADSRTLAVFESAERLVQGTKPTLPRAALPAGRPESSS
jgi:membrane protein required for colicin V production